MYMDKSAGMLRALKSVIMRVSVAETAVEAAFYGSGSNETETEKYLDRSLHIARSRRYCPAQPPLFRIHALRGQYRRLYEQTTKLSSVCMHGHWDQPLGDEDRGGAGHQGRQA
jgi:hypothetical protein